MEVAQAVKSDNISDGPGFKSYKEMGFFLSSTVGRHGGPKFLTARGFNLGLEIIQNVPGT